MAKTTDEILRGLPTAVLLWRRVDGSVSSIIGARHPIYDINPDVGEEGAIGRFTKNHKRCLQWLLVPHELEVRLVLYPDSDEGPRSLSIIVDEEGIQSVISATTIASEAREEPANFKGLLPTIRAMVEEVTKT